VILDPQAFNVIKKVYQLLKDKPAAELEQAEVAYITGLLESVIEIFKDEPGEEPRKVGWKNLIG
jgi:transcriptional regulatory protein LevR